MNADSAAPQPGSTFAAEDGTVSTVLPENHDPNYKPTQEELDEYAEFIGIDADTEPQLMWVAKKGLRTPLPDDWRACQTNEDEVYYFNFKTGESLWDHPMDEAFKQTVIEERAKLCGGGKAGGAKKAGGDLFGKITSTKAGAGTTRAISDSLFGKPVGAAGQPPLARAGSLGTVPGRLGGVGSPDVSDILALTSGANDAPFGSSRGLGGGGLGGLAGGRPSAFASPTGQGHGPPPPTGARDIEANIRRRVEEDFAPRRRQLGIDADKKLMEEKRAMEAEAAWVRRELDAAWEAERGALTATRSREMQRELKEIEESWQRRLKTVTDQVTDRGREFEERRAEMEAFRGQTTEQLKARLAEERAAAVAQRRAELLAAREERLRVLRVGHDEALQALARREAEAAEQATAAAEEANARKLAFQQEQNAKMLADLEAEVEGLRAELAVKTAEGGQAATPLSASGKAAPPPDKSAELTPAMHARIAAAQATADAAVDQIATASKAQSAAVALDLQQQAERLEAKLAAAAAALVAGTAPAPTATAASALTEEQETRLAREEARLQADLDTAVRTFNQQTDALVLRQQRQRTCSSVTTPTSATPATRTGGSSSFLGSPGQARGGALGCPAVLTLDGRLHQLDSKHEERMRHLREESKVAFKAKGLPYPREAEGFAKLFSERQRAWMAEHPAPSADTILPKLEPVPRFMTTMGDMPAVDPPSEDAVRAAVGEKLSGVRREHEKEEERQLAALHKEKRAELEALKATYRDERLVAVRAEVAARKTKLLATRPAPTPAAAAAAAAPSPKSSAQSAALQAEADAITAEMATSGTAHAQQFAQLRQSTAAVEASIRALLAELDAAVARTKASGGGGGQGGTSATPEPPQEPIVVTQFDYANYLSNDEARAEEAAVHAQWRAVLEGHRRDARQAQSAAAVAVALPPTAPLSAASFATPLQQTRLHPAAAAAEDGHGSLGYITPIGGGAAGLFPYSVSASTIGASPIPTHSRFALSYRDPHGYSLGSTAAHHHKQQQQQQLVSEAGAETLRAMRLDRLHDLLRQRRRELRGRQQRLEALREEWRADMRRCRDAADRGDAAMLKGVKARLEAEALVLNREVVNLKEAAGRLKEEQEQPPARGGPPQPQQQPSAADADSLLHTLLTVVERTERLETLLLNQTLAEQRRRGESSSSPPVAVPDEARGGKAPQQSTRVSADGSTIHQWLHDQSE